MPEIPSRTISDIVVLDMTSKFWLTLASLNDQVAQMLEGGSRRFILNLEFVDFLDSMAIGQFISLWSQIRNHDGNLVLLKPCRRVKIALQMTQLYDHFQVADDEENAVSMVRFAGKS